jgi:CheY-like chemotaxis protein
MKLLVIDDSHDITDLFVKVLTTVGHEVVATDNGKDGLDLLNRQKFDAVFLDIAMPNFSGLDVIENLLKNKKLEANPVVLFTASSITDIEVKDLIRKGVHSCIRKPVGIETLFEKLEELGNIQYEANATRKLS